MSFWNVARFALSGPNRFATMTAKVWKRVADPSERADEWVRSVESDANAFARELSPALWEEAKAFQEDLKKRCQPIMDTLPPEVVGSGSGFVWLLYFLVRRYKPTTVLETGVALGWSSAAILAALEKNAHGHLYSSDFPMFRIANPESYIGLLIEERLRYRWTLNIEGDRRCLQEILPDIDRIDLLHYDSDKSYSGRKFVLDAVSEKLKGPIVMDDIADNHFFREYSQGRKWRVFRNGHVPVGTIGI